MSENTKKAKALFLKYLKDLIKKQLVKKLFGYALTGIQGFLFITAFDYIWKKWLGPFFRFLWRKGEMVARRKQNEKKVDEVLDAETEDELTDSVSKLP